MATTDAWTNALVDSSFRDAADEDYVAARVLSTIDTDLAGLKKRVS